jgi:hypothetical protein
MSLLFFGFSVFLLLIMTLVLLSADKKEQYSRIEILRNGIRVSGQVIDLKFFGLFYRFPVVRFKTENGQYVTFTSSTKIAVGELSKGKQVEACYLPVAPEQFVIVSGLDVLVKSEAQVTEGPYRLAKGQERRSKRRSR